MSILVTGGAGYIGSHTCVSLLEAGHDIVIVDNLSNSSVHVVDRIREITDRSFSFYKLDVASEEEVGRIVRKHSIRAVIHFAGLKAVGESVKEPLKYYSNNVGGTLALLRACKENNINSIVFSSSATVYGHNDVPFFEDMHLQQTTNPYGETKAMCERILTDMAKANPDCSVVILRYFNPVGAHESGLIGERTTGMPNNLMPYVTKVAQGRLEKVQIFGNDYPTIDGTGVRDYIHVMDVAEGHLAALTIERPGIHIYNLGTGHGTSVVQLLDAFEEANGVSIPREFVSRRPGDIAVCYADVTKARRELGWVARRSLTDMCRDAWLFEAKLGD